MPAHSPPLCRTFSSGCIPWWERVGRARVRSVRDVERALTPALKELARRAAAFVHAAPDLTDVFMHVVPSPDVSNDEATGTAVRNHFFMELVPPDTVKEPAADVGKMVVSIGLHELTHAFYDSAPVQVHQEIMQQFVDSSDARAPSFYTYLNEAIATAVQEMADDEPGPTGVGIATPTSRDWDTPLCRSSRTRWLMANHVGRLRRGLSPQRPRSSQRRCRHAAVRALVCGRDSK